MLQKKDQQNRIIHNLTIPEPLQGQQVSGLVPGGTPLPPTEK